MLDGQKMSLFEELQKTKYHLLVALLLVGLFYSNTVHNDFALDDFPRIVENPTIKSLKNLPRFFTTEFSPSPHQNGLYRPIATLSYALNFAFSGFDTYSYHLVNLGIHLINVIVVYALILLCLGEPILAFLACLFFGLHPANTEAVTSLANRPDILCAGFYLLAFITYILGKNHCRQRWLSYLFFALALLSKEMAFTLPLILLGYEVIFAGLPLWPKAAPMLGSAPEKWPPLGRLLRLYLPYLLIFGIYLGVRYAVLGSLGPRDISVYFGGVNWLVIVATMIVVLAWYLKILLWPYPLALDFYYIHKIPNAQSFWETRVIVSLSIILLLIAGLAYLTKKQPKQAFFGLFFFATLIPVSNVIIPTGSLMAERFLYLPMLGYTTLLAVLLHRIFFRRTAQPRNLWRRIYAGLTVSAIIATIYGCVIYDRNRDWQTEKSLWEDTLRKNPRDIIARNNLSVLYMGIRDYRNAERVLKELLEIDPNFYTAYINLGNTYYSQGRYQDSFEAYSQALSIYPSSAEARHGLGQYYQATGDNAQAIEAYKTAITDNPSYEPPYFQLALLYQLTGKASEATVYYRKLIDLNPSYDQAYYNLGLILYQQGQIDQAIEVYQILLRIKPDSASGHYNMGVFALDKKEFETAEREFKTAISLDHDNEDAYRNLKVTYEKLDRIAEGIMYFQKALQKNPQSQLIQALLSELQNPAPSPQ
jgi:tetratricopeptide (TPR) repeat protein